MSSLSGPPSAVSLYYSLYMNGKVIAPLSLLAMAQWARLVVFSASAMLDISLKTREARFAMFLYLTPKVDDRCVLGFRYGRV